MEMEKQRIKFTKEGDKERTRYLVKVRMASSAMKFP
ncbi:hypothetical protein CCACVL1_03545 [Corchorus capsularis]|uniref:Uncharacterized protein n=1 Tax=Corchorus capsularis TaxID=210143 RepID=A0A1R3JYN9_COCAP|nr:hypothetical protein CCACVL1_03544 [Corchorus capsularis]OMO99943.1 hypothetical protein CCACVL1_03545 [Corchorus capsularis]